MKYLLFATVCLLCMGGIASPAGGEEQFKLVDVKSGRVSGPFAFRNNTLIRIEGKQFKLLTHSVPAGKPLEELPRETDKDPERGDRGHTEQAGERDRDIMEDAAKRDRERMEDAAKRDREHLKKMEHTD